MLAHMNLDTSTSVLMSVNPRNTFLRVYYSYISTVDSLPQPLPLSLIHNLCQLSSTVTYEGCKGQSTYFLVCTGKGRPGYTSHEEQDIS